MINVADYLDKSRELDTEAFQKAIDAGSAKGGEPVFVPFGTYKLATVILKDNTNLIFEDGVKIMSADSLNDFLADEPVTFKRYQDLSHSSYTKAMFYANNVENVSIRGGATIDMRSIWNPENDRSPADGHHRGAKAFALRKVKKLRLSGFSVLNATDIAVLMGACKDVIITGLYMHTHIDGISPDCCEDVVISDCIINAGDDAIVFKASDFDNQRIDCQRINVTNCVISSQCNAIKFGTESYGDMKYINVSNCTVYNTHSSGIAIESADGSNIYGINITNINMSNVANPIFVYCSDRLRAREGTEMGSISNVVISNIYADVHDEVYKSIDCWFPRIKEGSEYITNCSYPAMVMSTDENHKIKNVTLENIHLEVLGGGKLSDGVSFPDSKKYPESKNFQLPCYGLFVKNAENVKIDNFTCVTKYPDEREMIVIEK